MTHSEIIPLKRIKSILAAVLFSPVFLLNAQEITENQTDTTNLSEQIEEVTITAFRSPYNLFNTPAPIHLIETDLLKTGISTTPVEALNQVPGVLMHHGTLNTNRLTIRGIGSRTPYSTNKIKAYLGEIPLTSGDGETTLEDLENSSIKRVELIKGPSSSLYGAGLAGVLLFHPKNVQNDFVQNQLTIGSFGTVKNTLSAGLTQNRLNIYALGSALSAEGFRENNATKRLNFLINSMYNFSENVNLQLLLKSTKMKAYIPSSLDYETFVNTPEKAASNWMGMQGYEEYRNGQFGASLNIYTENRGKISIGTFGSFRDADELRPFNRLKENSSYIGWRGYIQKAIKSENFSLTLTTGFEFFREKYDWSTYSNQNSKKLSDNLEKRQYENLFFQMESGFSEKLFLSAGVNGNLTRFNYTDQFTENGDLSGSHEYKPTLSPRLGMNLVANEKLSFFGNISHGFSTPSFEETLLPDGELNPDIKPETGWNREIGFRSQAMKRIRFSVNYFNISVRNLLVARRTGEDAYIGVNAGKSSHKGMEAELKWNVTKTSSLPSLSITGNATLAHFVFKDFLDDGNDYSGKLLPGTAENTWLILARIKANKNIVANVWYRHTGRMPVNDANTDFSEAFGISNAELNYSGKHKQFVFEIKTGIQNIFDIKYASMLAVNAPSFGGSPPRYYYPGNPRNYFVTLLLGLN